MAYIGSPPKNIQCPIKKFSKVICLVVLYPNVSFFFDQVEDFYGTEEHFFGTPITSPLKERIKRIKISQNIMEKIPLCKCRTYILCGEHFVIKFIIKPINW